MTPVYQRLHDWESEPQLPPFRALPAVASWGMGPGVTRSRRFPGALVVQGDATSGVQLTSPAVAEAPGARVSVRADVQLQQGVVCVGALDRAGAKWLAAPNGPVSEFSFVVDDSGGFMVAIAKCSPASDARPTGFTIASPAYATEAPPRRRHGAL